MSSMKASTLSILPNMSAILLWKNSGAELIPYGYLPKSVANVVRYELSSSNAICMKPYVASSVLKYLELCNFTNISSAVGIAKCSRFIAELSDPGSKHILNDLPDFITVTNEFTHSVGSVTLVIS